MLSLCIVCFSCKDAGSPDSLDSFPSKKYTLDDNGQIENTEMYISDFEPASDCKGCHFDHWEEWSQSMHAYAMKDPVFFSGWNAEQHPDKRPDTGERFCIQCHNPAAFVTGENLAGYENAEDMADSGLPEVITEGIGCDACHTMTDLSPTVHTQDAVAATAEYHLNPGNIKYGNIQNPVSNGVHESEYNPIFSNSGICLPCHNITIRGVEAEITFSEWDRISSTAMGLFSCQECHMPVVTRPVVHEDVCPECPAREVHSHTFVGVDLNLSIPAEENPQFEIVTDLLRNALTVDFGTPYDDSVSIVGDSLIIPVTVTSLTAHSIPSGVPFAREAWLEVLVTDNDNNTLYQSGVVSDTTSLDISSDSDLLLFTAYLIDADGDTTGSVTDVSSIINNSLMAFSDRYKIYKVEIPTDITGEIKIQAKMRFRSFKPDILRGSHQNLLENLPIFDMAEDSAVVNISQ